MQMRKRKAEVIRCCLAVALIASLAVIVLDWDDVFRVVVRIPLVGWIVEYNFPPSDFYRPLDRTLVKSGKSKLVFICKYRGRHEIRIQGVTSPLFREMNVGMAVVVKDKAGRILYKNIKPSSRILGGSNGVYNYCYGVFDAPLRVPLGQQLTAEIECFGDTAELLREFPSAEIAVTKVFDK